MIIDIKKIPQSTDSELKEQEKLQQKQRKSYLKSYDVFRKMMKDGLMGKMASC